MTAKQYLNRIRDLDGQINRLERQRQDLRAMLFNTSSPANMGESVQTSTTESKWFALIAKVDELERDMVKEIDHLIDLKEAAAGKIEKISLTDKQTERNVKEVLFRYYIRCESFEQIAVEMSYTYRWICMLHGKGLVAFDEYLKSSAQFTKNQL